MPTGLCPPGQPGEAQARAKPVTLAQSCVKHTPIVTRDYSKTSPLKASFVFAPKRIKTNDQPEP